MKRPPHAGACGCVWRILNVTAARAPAPRRCGSAARADAALAAVL